MKLPDEIVEYIKEQAVKIAYGTISIELSDTGRNVDVISTSRRRFPVSSTPTVGKVTSGTDPKLGHIENRQG
jgi:hypothetical protein